MVYNENKKYAGFWVRTLAFVIDMLIIGLIGALPIKAVEVIFGKTSWMIIAILLIVLWGYYSYSIYKWRGTIGKKIVGLEVLDNELNPLSLKRASIRFVYSLITYTILFSPSLIAMMFINIYEPLGYLSFIVIFIPILIMFLNTKKKVLHDIFAKTVVVDIASITHMENNEEKSEIPKKISVLRRIGIIIIVLIGGGLLVYSAIFFYVFGSIYNNNKKSYDKSFHAKYNTNDYNDSRIIYYKKELEKYSEKFIEANSKYDIFEADVKKDLTLNCIQYFLQENNETEWIGAGSNFRKNARNKYANTQIKIEKAKKNEKYMGKNFYYYDLNDVNHIEDDIADVWGEKDKNKETCQKQLSSDGMYKMFISKYIKNREEKLERSKKDSELTRSGSILNKKFYIREVKETTEWLEILYKKYPEYLKEKTKKEEASNIEYQKLLKEAKIEEIKKKLKEKKRLDKKYKDEFEKSQYPIFTTIKYKKNEDLDGILWGNTNLEIKNKNGYTPLFVAISRKNIYAVKQLLANGANMYEMEKHKNYSAISWAAQSNSIEIMKLFLENNANINYQFNKNETALTIASKGCKNFEMVELLLNNEADPNLIDRYKKTTKTGLLRYCSKSKEDYIKMLDLIESKESFFNW